MKTKISGRMASQTTSELIPFGFCVPTHSTKVSQKTASSTNRRLPMKLLSTFIFLTATASAQTVALTPFPKFFALDNNGKPCNGCKLYTYAAGTTTPQATYTDSSGSGFNTNPVILDSAGRASVWLSNASYKLSLTTAAGASIWIVDNVSAVITSPYLPLAGGTMTGNLLFSAGQSVGTLGNPAGIIYLSGALYMGGASVIDSSKNGVFNNVTVGGALLGDLNLSTGNLKVAGTTVIDTARNASFANIASTGTATLNSVVAGANITLGVAGLTWNGVGTPAIGSGSQSWPLIYTNFLYLDNTGYVASGAALNVASGGILDINTGGTLSSNGAAGLSTTVIVPCGTLTFSDGILINKGTC